MKQPSFFVVASALLAALSGAAKCATLNLAMATITGYVSKEGNFFTGPVQRIHISCIDDKKVPDTRATSFQSNKQTLVPGRHQICVEAVINTARSSGKLWLDAKPGKSYIVRKRVVGYGTVFWIEDADTHEPVEIEQQLPLHKHSLNTAGVGQRYITR